MPDEVFKRLDRRPEFERDLKALKGTGSRSGMRVVYGYEEARDRVVFVELYFKGDKENEDRERIRTFLTEEGS